MAQELGVQMTKKRKKLVLNDKRAKLLKEVQKQIKSGRTPNISRAGKAAGYGTAVSAHRSFKRLKMQLPDLLDSVGLDAKTVLKGFKESLNATEDKFFAHNGVVIDTRKVKAHDIRLRARIALTGYHYPTVRDERLEPAATTPILNITLGFVQPGRAQAFLGAARERAGVGDSGQPDVDVEVDEEPGRSGPTKAVQTD